MSIRYVFSETKKCQLTEYTDIALSDLVSLIILKYFFFIKRAILRRTKCLHCQEIEHTIIIYARNRQLDYCRTAMKAEFHNIFYSCRRFFPCCGCCPRCITPIQAWVFLFNWYVCGLNRSEIKKKVLDTFIFVKTKI